MSALSSPPVRKDAARNRARLLQAADELFTTVGLDVTLKDVARQAGVGVGTVYRHFPTRDDLLNVYFTDLLDGVVSSAQAAADDPDGWRGLVRYLEDSMSALSTNCGLRGLVVAADSPTPLVDRSREAIAPLVQRMVDTAHEQGTLRPDVSAKDVTYIQVALAAVMDSSRDTEPQQYRRHLTLFLDGMRAPGSPPEPVA